MGSAVYTPSTLVALSTTSTPISRPRSAAAVSVVKNLKVMDATALALCRDQNMLLKVFSIFVPGALKRVVLGEDVGTLVHC